MTGAAPDRLGCSDCERLREGRIAQPVNTLSSGAYVVAGAGVVARNGRSGAPRAGQARLFGATLALVGLGSIAFHGPQPPGAQQLHDLPIDALVGLSVALPVARLARGRDPLPGRSRRRTSALGGLTAGAIAAYLAGRTGSRWCAPDSRWQWHGAWHVLSAAAFGVVGDVLLGGAERTR